MSPHVTDQPHDRLTRMCAAMTTTLDSHPEMTDDVKCIVFLATKETSGIQLHGYEDSTDAMVDLLVHLKAIFEAHGKTLMFAPINDG